MWTIAIGVGLGAVASAEDARRLFERGQASYAVGDYEDAVDAWTQAYAADARPALQYNLAQAYGRLGRVEDERTALVRFIERSIAVGVAVDDPQLETARARLIAIADRIRRTGIQLDGVPEDAVVLVDDVEVHGASIPLAPGSHTVQVRAPGFDEFHHSVVLVAGQTLAVPVDLTRTRSSPGNSSRTPLRATGIATLAAGGVALVAGTGYGIAALRTSDGGFEGTPAGDRARTYAVVADVAIGAGAGVAATGVALLLIARHGRRGDHAPTALVLPRVTHDGAGVVAIGRF